MQIIRFNTSQGFSFTREMGDLDRHDLEMARTSTGIAILMTCPLILMLAGGAAEILEVPDGTPVDMVPPPVFASSREQAAWIMGCDPSEL